MMDDLQPAPDYQTLLGKKILSLTALNGWSITLGTLVLIFQAKTVETFGTTQIEGIEWRIAEPNRELFESFYVDGLYRLVGVGVVFSRQSDYLHYLVAVQDKILNEFRDYIPF